jgi:hypothetical protein
MVGYYYLLYGYISVIFLILNSYTRLGYSCRNCICFSPHLARNSGWKDEEEVQDYLSYNVLK